jgi:ABC-type multidrug transport system fused ATPase/permease subunit
MLAVLEPDEGSITINCDDGTSFEADASLRPMFAYVPQGNMVLSGSIRKNISFLSDETDEEKIIEAAKVACIYDTIQELENGFDTVLGEGGNGLSEGQLQRLAVARAIYSDAPIILLDEATSALDEETEKKMLSNIKALKHRTCIIISHKESSLAVSDKVLFIENGKKSKVNFITVNVSKIHFVKKKNISANKILAYLETNDDDLLFTIDGIYRYGCRESFARYNSGKINLIENKLKNPLK